MKGINIQEVVVRMRSSLHVRQQTIAHGQCFGVGGCFRHWDGGMEFRLDADVFALLAMVNMIYSIHLSPLYSTMYSTILKCCEK